MWALHTSCCFYLDLAERNMSVRTVANSLAICPACKNTLPNEQAFARCEAVRQNSLLFFVCRAFVVDRGLHVWRFMEQLETGKEYVDARYLEIS